MKCEYCGNHLDYEITRCPTCGAPCKCVSRPQEKTPESIAAPQKETQPEKKEFVNMGDTDVSFLKQNQEARRIAEKNDGTSCGVYIGILFIIFFIIRLASC